jgi:hypothetical protein
MSSKPSSTKLSKEKATKNDKTQIKRSSTIQSRKKMAKSFAPGAEPEEDQGNRGATLKHRRSFNGGFENENIGALGMKKSKTMKRISYP